MVWFRKKVTFYVFLFFRKAFCLKVPHKGVSSHLFRKLIWKELSTMKLDFRGPADDWAAHLLLIFAHLYLINSQSWTNERMNEHFALNFSSFFSAQPCWGKNCGFYQNVILYCSSEFICWHYVGMISFISCRLTLGHLWKKTRINWSI
jgi:hypothetical protein